MIADRRGVIHFPSREEILHETNTLVEFYEPLDENNEGKGFIQKMLIRIHNLSDEFDYSYVLAREGFIISAWANDKNDIHRLDGRGSVDYYRPAILDDEVAQ